MKIKTEPKQIWQEYQDGVNYKAAIDLYENVTQNENFFIGKQWEGVNAPDLPKPTLNFLKRVVSYFIAMLVTDDIAVSLKPFKLDPEIVQLSAAVSEDVKRIIEQERGKEKNRDAIRNAAVDGDACFYLWFDPNKESGQYVKGDIRMELVSNINCHFGNQYVNDVQSQPYIIIVLRRLVGEVRDEVMENGGNPDDITGDTDAHQNEQDSNDQLCTVLIKLWKEKIDKVNKDGTVDNGHTIKAIKVTDKAIVKPEWDTGLSLYPVAWMSWEKVMASYHGQAALTGLIQNQISVNRLLAMTIRSVELNAFPKILYDKSKFPNGWNNRVGEALGVTGDPNAAYANVFRGADVSAQVSEVVEKIVSMTRDFMGANDAALGNVKPDNTSAIIAVQQASAIPLEANRRALYDFVEQYIRIMVDIMRANYGARDVNIEIDSAKMAEAYMEQSADTMRSQFAESMPSMSSMNIEETQTARPFDPVYGGLPPEALQNDEEFIGETPEAGYPNGAMIPQNAPENVKMKVTLDYGKIDSSMLNVDIGSAAYWSEIMQMQTMDNLISNGVISDLALYLESIPDKYLPNKTKLIESVKERQTQQQTQANMMQLTPPANKASGVSIPGNTSSGVIQ